jgi:hypothetical protein
MGYKEVIMFLMRAFIFISAFDDSAVTSTIAFLTSNGLSRTRRHLISNPDPRMICFRCTSTDRFVFPEAGFVSLQLKENVIEKNVSACLSAR